MILAFNQAHSFRTPSKRSCGPHGKTHQLSIEHRLDASPAQALREMLEPGSKGWIGAYLGSVTEGLALARAQEKGGREFWLFLSWLWVNGTLCYQKWYRCAFLLKQGIRNLLLNVATDVKSICFLHACFIKQWLKERPEREPKLDLQKPTVPAIPPKKPRPPKTNSLNRPGALPPRRPERPVGPLTHTRYCHTAMLFPRRVGLGWTQGAGKKWESSFV